MKKIVTALDNAEVIKALKKEEELEFVCMDILYKEGIIEQLEINKKVDFLIFDENIYGDIEISELIRKIKEIVRGIEIIIITKNGEKIKKQISRFKKIKIYETNKIKAKIIKTLIFSEEKEEKEIDHKENKQQEKTQTKISISGSRRVWKNNNSHINGKIQHTYSFGRF